MDGSQTHHMTDIITPMGDHNFATASTSAAGDDHTLEINAPATDPQSMSGDDISMPDQQDPVPNNTESVMPSEESTQPTHNVSPVPVLAILTPFSHLIMKHKDRYVSACVTEKH